MYETTAICPNCRRTLLSANQIVACQKCRMGWWLEPNMRLTRLPGQTSALQFNRYGVNARWG